MRTAITGRYVRIQLEGTEYLSLAEVQIFSIVSKSMDNYVGGNPIIGGTYNPEGELFSY